MALDVPSRADEPLDLSVVYAGEPGSDRQKDFTTFLSEHFAKVHSTDYRGFQEREAEGYDVVIIDWTSVYPRDESGTVNFTLGTFKMPPTPKLTAKYKRPTVLIGAAGGWVAGSLNLKINWHCLCLDDSAHDVVSTHEIFRKPFAVDLRFDDRRVPRHYRNYPKGKMLGKTMKVWRVQTKRFPDIDPGLVSDPRDFAGSSNVEVIASGLNAKEPGAVALARDANFFLWGFSGSPQEMTPEAQKCFVNVVSYIKKFDGQKTSHKPSKPDPGPPVVARAVLSSKLVRPGDIVTLTIRVQAAPTWYIYAVERAKGPGIATSLNLRLPRDVQAEGGWACPEPSTGVDDQMFYAGTVEFHRKLRVRADSSPGTLKVACDLGFQACDFRSCRPPIKLELVAECEVTQAK